MARSPRHNRPPSLLSGSFWPEWLLSSAISVSCVLICRHRDRICRWNEAPKSPGPPSLRLPRPPYDHSPSNEKRSEEHTSELQSLMRISYAVFCLKKKTNQKIITHHNTHHTQQTYSSQSRTK